jgi:hypothetical protein
VVVSALHAATHFLTALNSINKGMVKLVCAERVWNFAEVHFECCCNGMYILKRFLMFIANWYHPIMVRVSAVTEDIQMLQQW